MWRYRLANNLGTTDVLFCAPKKDELIFFDDMEELAKDPNFNVYFSVTREPDADWPHGKCRFTIDTIKEHTTNYEESVFYLCGSPTFCEGMMQLLLDNDVPKDRVKMEKYW